MDTDQIKQFKIVAKNTTALEATDLHIKTNLAADQYSAVVPRTIPPKSTGVILLNLNGKALWDAKLDAIGFEIGYGMVKVIGH